MGREAEACVELAGARARVVVLLESDVLIFRRPLVAKLRRDAMEALRVEGNDLVGEAPQGVFRVTLGAKKAASWLQALTTPPPSLAQKLGLEPGVTVWISGDIEDPDLADALGGAPRLPPGEAALRILIAASEANLDVIRAHAPETSSPVWVIHGKGPATGLGANQVRACMRSLGWRDVKIAAVSDKRSAIQFRRRR